MGFGPELLKWAGASPNIKHDFLNLFKIYFGDNERDLEKVEFGITLYNQLKMQGFSF